MGQLILSHLVLVWAIGALLVGAFDPLGEFSTGEQAFNGIFMLFIVGGAGAWAQRSRDARKAQSLEDATGQGRR